MDTLLIFNVAIFIIQKGAMHVFVCLLACFVSTNDHICYCFLILTLNRIGQLAEVKNKLLIFKTSDNEWQLGQNFIGLTAIYKMRY